VATSSYKGFTITKGAVSTSACAAPNTRVGSNVLVATNLTLTTFRIYKPSNTQVKWISVVSSADRAPGQGDDENGFFQCNGYRNAGDFVSALSTVGASNLAFSRAPHPFPSDFVNVDFISCLAYNSAVATRFAVIDDLVVEVCPA
jgi:hypothetical protein